MIGFKIGSLDTAKGQFFDREAVMNALEAGQKKVLSQFGSYVRTRARSSIRPARVSNAKEVRAGKAKGLKRGVRKIYLPSEPGKPPRSRRGDLKQHIYFVYESDHGNVVIGPTQVRGQETGTPARLEFGGEAQLKKGRGIWVGNPPRKIWLHAGQRVKTAARPFMRPAFDKEMSLRMPAMFKDSMPSGFASSVLSGSIA
jgi:hypothetical protein